MTFPRHTPSSAAGATTGRDASPTGSSCRSNVSASRPVTPTAAFEVEQCDECVWTYSVEVLTPIVNAGLLCGRCVDELRLMELAA